MIRQVKEGIAKIRQNDFFKNTAILVTGTSIAQIIPLLVSPIVARLYAPGDYAVLATYTSVTVLLTIIATGMYDAALMLDKSDEDAVNTGAAAVLITLLITFISALVMLFFRANIAHLSGNDNIQFWLYLVPITVFCYGFYQTLNVWNNRKKRYKRLSSNRILMTAISSSLTIGCGFLGLKEKGLLISLIVGQILAFLLLLTQTLKTDKILFSKINKVQIIRSFKRHSDFPKYNMPQGFIDGIKESSTIWIISNFFGASVLGSFSFAKSIIMRPLQIIGNSVSQVFYQKASGIFNETGNIYKISRNTFIILFSVGLPFALVVLFWGDNLFTFIFGSNWKEAGVISQILIVWIFVSFIASPFGNVPLILKRQKLFFYIALSTNLIPVFVLFIVGKINNNSILGFSSFAFSSLIMYILLFLWLRHILISKP